MGGRHMNATIGDAIDWRAEMRANDIPRRPAHAPRPDRGYVDQSPPETPRPPSVIPLERPIEAQAVSKDDDDYVLNQLLAEEAREKARAREAEKLTPAAAAALAMEPPEPEATLPPSAGPSTVGQANLVRFERATIYAAPPPPPEPPAPAVTADTFRRARLDPRHPDGRRYYSDEFRAEVVADFIRDRQAGDTRTQKEWGEARGLNQSAISNWLKAAGYSVTRLGLATRVPGQGNRAIDAETRRQATEHGLAAVQTRSESLNTVASAAGVHTSTLSAWVKEEMRKTDEAPEGEGKKTHTAQKLDDATWAAVTARAVEAKLTGGESLATIAREYGVHPSNLSTRIAAELRRRDYTARAQKRLATMGLTPKSERAPETQPEKETTLLSRPTPSGSSSLPDLGIPPKQEGEPRRLSDEQKRALLAYGAREGLSGSELGRRYDVAETQIRNWREKYGFDGQKGLRKPKAQKGSVTVVATAPKREQTNGSRTFESVTAELQAALAEMNELGQRVGALKRELRGLLDD